MTPHAIIQPSLFYRELPLTRGQVALVDIEDYPLVNQWKWLAHFSKFTGTFYVEREGILDGKPRAFMLHRVIMGLKHGDKRLVDHINHNTLDNRRFNLRIVTRSQNKMNSKLYANNKLGLKGVHLSGEGRWRAQIRCDKKNYYLGQFPSPEEAHRAYCAAAIQLHGDYARFE